MASKRTNHYCTILFSCGNYRATSATRTSFRMNNLITWSSCFHLEVDYVPITACPEVDLAVTTQQCACANCKLQLVMKARNHQFVGPEDFAMSENVSFTKGLGARAYGLGLGCRG